MWSLKLNFIPHGFEFQIIIYYASYPKAEWDGEKRYNLTLVLKLRNNTKIMSCLFKQPWSAPRIMNDFNNVNASIVTKTVKTGMIRKKEGIFEWRKNTEKRQKGKKTGVWRWMEKEINKT